MRSIMLLAAMLGVSLYAASDCDNSVLVVHNMANLPMKVYVDGSTGTNAPTPAVTVSGIPPGQHQVKVVAVYTDENGETKRRTIYNGHVNFRGSRYMDAWVEEGKGVAIHETQEPCNGEIPEGSEPPINPNAPHTPETTVAAVNPGQADNPDQPVNESAQYNNKSASPSAPISAPGSSAANAGNLAAHISDDDFEALKNAIAATQYEVRKMDTLKLLTANDLFSTSQVGDLMGLFAFESNKLDVAKLLYDRTVDKQNYSRLSSHFNFDARKEDFKNFLAGK